MKDLSAMEAKEELRIGKRLAENTNFSLREVNNMTKKRKKKKVFQVMKLLSFYGKSTKSLDNMEKVRFHKFWEQGA